MRTSCLFVGLALLLNPAFAAEKQTVPYEAIVDACCNAWNALIATHQTITSIGTRAWAQVKI